MNVLERSSLNSPGIFHTKQPGREPGQDQLQCWPLGTWYLVHSIGQPANKAVSCWGRTESFAPPFAAALLAGWLAG
jgi:hypothetical protein